jgi:hypothetical protein
MPFALMATAWILYDRVYVQQDFSYDGATSNHGRLVRPPLPVDQYFPNRDKPWSVLIANTTVCGVKCRDRLYDTRQVHIALGREAYRLERIYWSAVKPSKQLRDLLTEQHRGLQILTGPEVKVLVDKVGVADFYLVDPNGFLMMAYDERHSGKDLLEDLKFLMKFSR